VRPDQTVFQQIPLITNWRVTDNADQVREIMREHEQGNFLSSSVFWEEILTDDRIGAVMDTRIGGLLAADLHFVPSEEKSKAKKLADVLGGHDQTEDDGLWLRMMDPDTAAELLKWKIGLGVAFGPITWETKNGEWVPRVTPWHPRFLRFDWGTWRFAVVSWGQPVIYLPRTDEEARGDGKWFFWGGYRSWMTGLVRSLGMPYIDRTWQQRDAARYSEKYGLNLIEGKVPSGATDAEKADFGEALQNLGSEPTIVTPQGRSKDDASFGIEIHECTAQGWQIFKERENSLNTNVAVRVLGQNLTTEVKGGSLAASKVHEGIRGDVKRRDAHFFKAAREQILTWWAYFNYGDPNLAPYPRPAITAALDPVDEATQLLTLMQAVAQAPPEVDTAAILEAHGVPVLEGQALTAKLARLAATRPQAGLPGDSKPGAKTVGDATASKMASAIAGEAQESPESEEASTATGLTASLGELVALKAGTIPAKRQAKYHEAVAAIARRKAAKALQPLIEETLGEINRAQSFEDIKRFVIRQARAKGAGVSELAKIVERVNILANLQGRSDVLDHVLK
jgi:phage gp29-like protein